MKKNKHVTINLDEWQYSILEELSLEQNRNITNTAYLIIVDSINNHAKRKGYIKGYEYISNNN